MEALRASKENLNRAHTLAKLKMAVQAKVVGETKDRAVTVSLKTKVVLLKMKMIQGKLTILLM